MIQVVVMDLTAESRSRIYEKLSSFLFAQVPSATHLIPQLNIRSVSNHELRFQSAPDICVVGHQIIEEDPSEVRRVRGLYPRAMILAEVQEESLAQFEELVRFGVDDTFSDLLTPEEFFKKIILLNQRETRTQVGRVILVDSGKGGVGVTSVAAALGETLSRAQKKVALIDLDGETQDLTRFLRVRPYLNENLQLILQRSRPASQELIEQSVAPIWEGDRSFVCMPPSSDQDQVLDQSVSTAIFLQILQSLDSMYEVVIVDVGSVRGATLRALYEIANHIVFVVNNDPAALHAAVEKLRRFSRSSTSNDAFLIVENNSQRVGLSSAFLREEFLKISLLDPTCWCRATIPHCDAGLRWPGSGSTLLSASNKGTIRNAFHVMANQLGLMEMEKEEKSFFRSMTQSARSAMSISFAKQSQKLLPAPVVDEELPRDARLVTGAKLY